MADSNSSKERTGRIAWYCGTMKAEALIMGNRVIDYRWVPVGGCGWLNRPNETHCENCGKKRGELVENARNEIPG